MLDYQTETSFMRHGTPVGFKHLFAGFIVFAFLYTLFHLSHAFDVVYANALLPKAHFPGDEVKLFSTTLLQLICIPLRKMI